MTDELTIDKINKLIENIQSNSHLTPTIYIHRCMFCNKITGILHPLICEQNKYKVFKNSNSKQQD